MKASPVVAAVAFAVGLLVAVLPGCGKTCDASHCPSGCCDANGACQTGSLTNACGTNGAICTACQLGEVCALGVCRVANGVGGGAGGGSGGGSATGGGSSVGGGSATGGGSGSGLIGTWLLTTTPTGLSSDTATLTIGQDSFTVQFSGGDTLTAIRANSNVTYVLGGGSVSSTQTQGTFDTGVIPFDLGGSWVITSNGSSPVHCTAAVSPTQFDGTCTTSDTYSDLNFNISNTRTSPAQSSYGDFGGTWNATWHHTADAGSMATETCVLNLGGNNLTTCTSGGHPLSNITFTMNAALTMASGTTSGAEFSLVKQ